jgi:hypothetical protein
MSLYRNEREYALYTKPAKRIEPAPIRHNKSNTMRTIAVIVIALAVGYSLCVLRGYDCPKGFLPHAKECRK